MHGKDGFGRTGTFIALVNAIMTIKEQKLIGIKDPQISIFSIVRRLREQRFDMVDSFRNYKFLYKAIDVYAKMVE